MFRGIESKDATASQHREQAEVWSQPPEICNNYLTVEKGQWIQPSLNNPPLWFCLFSKILLVWYLCPHLCFSWALLRAKANSCWPAYLRFPPSRAPLASAYKYEVIKLEVESYITWVKRTVTCKNISNSQCWTWKTSKNLLALTWALKLLIRLLSLVSTLADGQFKT